MFKKGTVFILGAGASFPYGLPTGEDLRNSICEDKSKLGLFLEREKNRDQSKANYLMSYWKFVQDFSQAHTASIDKYLSQNATDYSGIGKITIAHDILYYESKTKITRHKIEGDGDWYHFLFNLMIEDLNGEYDYKDFYNRNYGVSFVTFNYDRSLEHYLFTSLLKSFTKASKDEIIKQLKSIPIYHIYGSIAPLKWQLNEDESFYWDYGNPKIDFDSLKQLSDNIRIVYDERGDSFPEISKAKRVIKDANEVYLLGFGYAKENIDILGLRNRINIKAGTALGY